MQHSENKDNIDLQKLQDQLETQYGPAIAQDIVDRLRKNTAAATKTPDYMDVKAMSELQEKLRAEAMLAVWRLKEWRRKHGAFSAGNLVPLEGLTLQRQCEEAIRLYRRTHKSYFAMYRRALAMAPFTATARPFTTAQSA